jgi:hypothetical protein
MTHHRNPPRKVTYFEPVRRASTNPFPNSRVTGVDATERSYRRILVTA